MSSTFNKKGNIFGAEQNGYGWDVYGNLLVRDVQSESGVMRLKETTTPAAVTNYGKVYTKNDNKIYFQDGAGNEHEITIT